MYLCIFSIAYKRKWALDKNLSCNLFGDWLTENSPCSHSEYNLFLKEVMYPCKFAWGIESKLPRVWMVRKDFVHCTETEIHSLKLSIKIPNLLAVLRCNWYIINCTHLKWYTVFDKFWHMYMFNEDNKHIHQLLKVSLCLFMSLIHPLSLAPHLWATADLLSVTTD